MIMENAQMDGPLKISERSPSNAVFFTEQKDPAILNGVETRWLLLFMGHEKLSHVIPKTH
jgi:hypothetical protein